MTIVGIFFILVEPQIWLLWALNNPFYLSTDPLQEERDDAIPTRLIAWANADECVILPSFNV